MAATWKQSITTSAGIALMNKAYGVSSIIPTKAVTITDDISGYSVTQVMALTSVKYNQSRVPIVISNQANTTRIGIDIDNKDVNEQYDYYGIGVYFKQVNTGEEVLFSVIPLTGAATIIPNQSGVATSSISIDSYTSIVPGTNVDLTVSDSGSVTRADVEKIVAANQSFSFPKKPLATGIDLQSIKSIGIYQINDDKTVVNAPDGFSGNGYLIVVGDGTTANPIVQEVTDTVTGNKSINVYNSSLNKWDGWQQFSYKSYVDDSIKSANEHTDNGLATKADDSKVVHTADMRKPASDVAGIEEVNAKQDKIGYTPADDSKVVHTADMRKVPSDVAGIEEVNAKQDKIGYTPADDSKVSTLQTQVNNSAVGTNLLTTPFSDRDRIIDDSPNTVRGYACDAVYNNLIAGSVYTFSSDVSVVGTATSIDVKPFNPTTHNTIDDSYTTFPIVNGKISGLVKPTDGYNTLLVYAGNKGNTHGNKVTFHHMKLEKGSVATDWCPNPAEILTKSDDSKVAHLSGANNFDTTPTVNNNPLLLASSLPSDLARTGQDANFTGKLQQNGQDVALANNTIARNPNTGVVSEPVDFTNLTVNGGKSVATRDDLKSLEASAWRPLTLANSTSGTILFKDNGDGTASLTGSANFTIAKGSTTLTPVIIPPTGYTFTSLKWSKGINNKGVYVTRNMDGDSSGISYVFDTSLSNGDICFLGSYDDIYTVTFSPSELTTLNTAAACNPALVSISKV